MESEAASEKVFVPRQKTEAELKFEEMQRKRQLEKVKKAAAISHKQKVAV